VPSLLDDMMLEYNGQRMRYRSFDLIISFRLNIPPVTSRRYCHFNFALPLAYPLVAWRSRKTWYSELMTLRGRVRIELNQCMLMGVAIRLTQNTHKVPVKLKGVGSVHHSTYYSSYTCSDRASVHHPSRRRIPNGKKLHIY